jgi:hypothetical protein
VLRVALLGLLKLKLKVKSVLDFHEFTTLSRECWYFHLGKCWECSVTHWSKTSMFPLTQAMQALSSDAAMIQIGITMVENIRIVFGRQSYYFDARHSINVLHSYMTSSIELTETSHSISGPVKQS